VAALHEFAHEPLDAAILGEQRAQGSEHGITGIGS
jgi:hypothetical protein